MKKIIILLVVTNLSCCIGQTIKTYYTDITVISYTDGSNIPLNEKNKIELYYENKKLTRVKIYNNEPSALAYKEVSYNFSIGNLLIDNKIGKVYTVFDQNFTQHKFEINLILPSESTLQQRFIITDVSGIETFFGVRKEKK